MTDAPADVVDPQELRFEPELRKALEAILLVVDEPVDVDTLAQVLEVAAGDVEDVLLVLAAEYAEQGRGFVLRRAGGGWRMYTDPGAASYVERFVLHGRSGRLSQSALETLAIVAYKQPVTRAAISEIRGVDADAGVRNLLTRGLVEEVGRADQPGQPLLYATTTSFLEKLGIDDLEELPALPDLSPVGPPPPEPSPGGYKAARKELDLLPSLADDDAAIEAALRVPLPRPGDRLTALLHGEDLPAGDAHFPLQADDDLDDDSDAPVDRDMVDRPPPDQEATSDDAR